MSKIKAFIKEVDFGWRTLRDFALIILGSLVQSLAIRYFLVPATLVSGGVAGLSQFFYYLWGWPIGMVTLLANIPLFVLGWKYLGGPRFAIRTILTVLSYTVITDLLLRFTGTSPITNDILLNTLYGGILLGIGLGLVYMGRGTSGGTDIIVRILGQRYGISLSLAYMVTDSLPVFLAGFHFGWDKALYGLIMIYLGGMAADMVTEGTDIIREAMIITDESQAVIDAISEHLGRGATLLQAKGSYTQKERPVIFCVVTAAEVIRLKMIVRDIDPKAFMVVGHANEALGEGFKPLSDK